MFPEDAQTLQMPVIVFDNSMAKQINVEPKKVNQQMKNALSDAVINTFDSEISEQQQDLKYMILDVLLVYDRI